MSFNPTILIIMSDGRREALSDQLQGVSHHIFGVSGCGEAREFFDSGRPVRVVVTDAELPDGDWRTVLEVVERARPEAPVIVCASTADANFWCDALDRGAYDLLVEPYEQEEVRRIVQGAATSTRVHLQAA